MMGTLVGSHYLIFLVINVCVLIGTAWAGGSRVNPLFVLWEFQKTNRPGLWAKAPPY